MTMIVEQILRGILILWGINTLKTYLAAVILPSLPGWAQKFAKGVCSADWSGNIRSQWVNYSPTHKWGPVKKKYAYATNHRWACITETDRWTPTYIQNTKIRKVPKQATGAYNYLRLFISRCSFSSRNDHKRNSIAKFWSRAWISLLHLVGKFHMSLFGCIFLLGLCQFLCNDEVGDVHTVTQKVRNRLLGIVYCSHWIPFFFFKIE